MKAAVLLTLLASVTAIAVAPAARACRYCQQAADPVEVMRFQGQGRNAGSFPLDDSLNSYGGNRTPTPPAIVTTAAGLPARPAVAAAAAAPAPALIPAPAPAIVQPTPPAPASVRWADLGLVALAGAGGWFAWRTRTVRPVATTA